MRLLHSTSLEFRVFYDDEIPPYLILSHTWGDEEINYQEMRFLQRMSAHAEDLKQEPVFIAALAVTSHPDLSTTNEIELKGRLGYEKIEKSAARARERNLEYFWVDTCCIDKSSSAELQEAINSMYRWYQMSHTCAVHLETPWLGPEERLGILPALRTSKWVTRGWTLQELIAPSRVAFYGQNWDFLGYKHDHITGIAQITGIPAYVLETGNTSWSSVAQKMSWAAKRTTTRVEDRAYSLMGLFNVHMSMHYGEREVAFQRLQQEIIKTDSDDSIFAWTTDVGSISRYYGLLAQSPLDFQHCSGIISGHGTFTLSSRGIQMEYIMESLSKTGPTQKWDDSIYACDLKATDPDAFTLQLYFRRSEGDKFVRIMTDSVYRKSSIRERWQNPSWERKTFLVEHTPRIPQSFESSLMHCFHIKFRNLDPKRSNLQIESVHPGDLWDDEQKELKIPHFLIEDGEDLPVYKDDLDFRLAGTRFVGIVTLKAMGHNQLDQGKYRFLIGYDLPKKRVWCKDLHAEIAGQPLPDSLAPTKEWNLVLQRKFLDVVNCKSYDQLSNENHSKAIAVYIAPGLHRGWISHIVYIDKLI